MVYNHSEHILLRQELREYLKKIRKSSELNYTKTRNKLDEVIFTEQRTGFIDGEPVERLVIFLRGTGCSLTTETGGCTFCGFYNATNFGEQISDEDYILQVQRILATKAVELQKSQIVCLYNDGSMLNEKEISLKALTGILGIISNFKHIKKVVLEARVEDISERKLKAIKEATDLQLEISVGFESANPMIRDLCINKSFDNAVFERNVALAKKNNISIVPLLMLKPPFLSEMEAINDYVESLQYLEQFNLNRIDMELPTIEKYTLMYELWKRNMYSPVKLWSVIEILKIKSELNLKTKLYISPTSYSVPSESRASNCTECDTAMFTNFGEYNINGDVNVFKQVHCQCKKGWKDLISSEKISEVELPVIIQQSLKILQYEYASSDI